MDERILASRITGMKESATLAMTKRSRDLKDQGIDVIALSIGEPDFDTPEPVKDAAKKAIDNNITHYPPVPGFSVLREAIANKLKRDNNIEYAPSQIVVSNGAKQSIANVLMCILNEGDEVIIPSPYWVSYPAMVKMGGGISVIIDAGIDQDYKVTPAQIEEAITPKTKAFLFNSPSNPTGSVYTVEEIEAIAMLFKKYPDVLFISDEIYEYNIFEGQHQSPAAYNEIKDQVVIVNGVSKGFAMTGWRIGYIAAPEFIAKACSKLQGQYTSGAGTISQMAALEAINTVPMESPDLHKMITAFRERRDLLIGLLDEIPGVKTNRPSGAFYLFPDVSYYFGKSNGQTTISSSTDLCLYLLDKAHVATVPGDAFGSPSSMRISYAASEEEIVEAIKRIKPALEALIR
jgi:aspartate aminotransferase